MRADLEAVARVLANASCVEDVFGPLKDLAQLRAQFRKIIVPVHPDHFTGADQVLANETFRTLTQRRTEAEAKLVAGTYGDRKGTLAPATKGQVFPQVIKAPKKTYVATCLLAEGDVADLYRASFTEGGKETEVVLKLAANAADNDLLENEARVLGILNKGEIKSYMCPPMLHDSFALKGSSGSRRRCNVLELADGYVSLEAVKKAFPKGLDFRDVAWMFKRALAGLWAVHKKQVIHGALLPSHILVHPTGHGAKFVDWSYAVSDWPKGDRVKALVRPYRAFYPSEITEKRSVFPETDIFLLGKTMLWLLGGDVTANTMPDSVPAPIQGFVKGFLLAKTTARPNDAGALHQELDTLLEKLVGKRKYRPLTVPAS